MATNSSYNGWSFVTCYRFQRRYSTDLQHPAPTTISFSGLIWLDLQMATKVFSALIALNIMATFLSSAVGAMNTSMSSAGGPAADNCCDDSNQVRQNSLRVITSCRHAVQNFFFIHLMRLCHMCFCQISGHLMKHTSFWHWVYITARGIYFTGVGINVLSIPRRPVLQRVMKHPLTRQILFCRLLLVPWTLQRLQLVVLQPTIVVMIATR